MQVENQQLRAFLQDAGLLKPADFDRAKARAQQQQKSVEEVLVAEKLVSAEELAKLKAYILGIPFINLVGQEIPNEVLKIIPQPIARTHNIVAYQQKGNVLEVAMLDPDDLRTIEFVRKKAGLKILPRLTSEESIKNALRQYQETLQAEFGELIKQEADEVKSSGEQVGLQEPEDLHKKAQELPVIRIVDTLVKHAILQRASDIHIEPSEKEVVVRYRIDGILHDAMVLPRQVAPAIVARIKVLANLKLDEHRLPQDGRFKVESADFKFSLRVSVMPVMEGEKIVMRLLPETAQTFTLEQLGFQGESLELIQHNVRKPVGMILVTGPTGSGKTTTLYTLMEMLNDPGVNISTTEDPIEYRIPRVNQTQINAAVGLTFANSLRSLMRQDPDIIMVGEIRDQETAALAINAALTGHLVLSTLHTNSAAGAIPRLIDMGVEPFLLASTLNIIVAQRLVRKLCRDKESYSLTTAQTKDFEQKFALTKLLAMAHQNKKLIPASVHLPKTANELTLYRPTHSKECADGYKGRVGIYETLPVNETIKELIVKRATSDQIEQQARKEGMLTMAEDGFLKALVGSTSLEEVMRVTTE